MQSKHTCTKAVALWRACHTSIVVVGAPEQNWFLITTACTTRASSVGKLILNIESMLASASVMPGLAIRLAFLLELHICWKQLDPTVRTHAMKSLAIGMRQLHTFLRAQ